MEVRVEGRSAVMRIRGRDESLVKMLSEPQLRHQIREGPGASGVDAMDGRTICVDETVAERLVSVSVSSGLLE